MKAKRIQTKHMKTEIKRPRTVRDYVYYIGMNIMIGAVLMVFVDDFVHGADKLTTSRWWWLMAGLSCLSAFTLGRWMWRGLEWLVDQTSAIPEPEPESGRRLRDDRTENVKTWKL